MVTKYTERVLCDSKSNAWQQTFPLRSLSCNRVELHRVLEHVYCRDIVFLLLHQQAFEKVRHG